MPSKSNNLTSSLRLSPSSNPRHKKQKNDKKNQGCCRFKPQLSEREGGGNLSVLFPILRVCNFSPGFFFCFSTSLCAMHTFRAAAKPVMGTHGFVETFACEHYRRSLADTKNGYTRICISLALKKKFEKKENRSGFGQFFFQSRQFFLLSHFS